MHQENELSDATGRDPKMAKKQRSLLLDENLARLVDAYQQITGATFTRVIAAALIQYLLDRASGPDSRWMRFAVALERGDVTLPDISLQNAEQKVAEKTRLLEQAPNRSHYVDVKKHPTEVNDTYTAWCREQRDLLLGYYGGYSKCIKQASDPMQPIINHWAKAPSPDDTE